MADIPLERCPKCDKKLIYLKVKRKNDKAEVEAICLEGHKKSFTTSLVKKPAWVRLMAQRILSCAVCGGRAVPDRDTMKKEKYKDKFKVRCRTGCNDKYEREVAKGLADAIRRMIAKSRKMGLKPFQKPFPKPGVKPYPRRGGRYPRRKPSGMQPKSRIKLIVPEECPKCDAPLKKEQIEQLRKNEVVECKYCGSAIQPEREEI